ncbi:MAG TPA: NmrA family NAD(P)-binding protein [Polyangiales bacterium]|nr:NmrA family NAD(P)-binding protein [Polyangiales bacterium]
MANEKSTVLVVGATGTVGREVLRAAVRAGARVRALVRAAASANELASQVEVVVGDLRDEAAVQRALQGVRAAFYVSPHEPDEEALAERFIRACEASGARLVFGGVHIDAASRLGRWAKRALYSRIFPHYAPKFRLGERMRQSRANPVVLVPTNFFQNDELFLPEILAGHFVQGFERPVNRIDVRDLGEAALRALLDDSVPSGAYAIVGPESLTGEACAAVWAQALGRPVRSAPEHIDAAIERAMSGKKGRDFRASYQLLRRFELPTRPAELAQTAYLLGRQPTPYSAYVRDLAASVASSSQRRLRSLG